MSCTDGTESLTDPGRAGQLSLTRVVEELYQSRDFTAKQRATGWIGS